ncbi:hypothetical protein [Tepidibacter sp. Z1-5]|uniref:hypothetical protein n=1 Tax=Tepidibacter sp. Z1-5 TaxID=3134138 RepID=UPI0030C16D4E
MKKIFIFNLINVLFFLIFYIIYFFQMSKELYGVGFLPFFHLIGIPFTIILICILNYKKIILKHKKEIILKILIAIFLFIAFTKVIDYKYRYILWDYYNRYDYDTLWELEEYKNKPKNYINLTKLLRKHVNNVRWINEGFNDGKKQGRFYLINHSYYVFLNRNNTKVLDIVNGEKILKQHLDLINNKKDIKIISSYISSVEMRIKYRNSNDKIVEYYIEPKIENDKIKFYVKTI